MNYKLKIVSIFAFILSVVVFKGFAQLENSFSNCLISDIKSNISRSQPIIITGFDEDKNRIKTNYPLINQLKTKATGNQSWFVVQGEEGNTIVEIIDVDLVSGWITLGETYRGILNMDEGETIEFFNPFVNYEVINDAPLFKEYPKYINDEYIGYIQAGGIIKRDKNDYILLTPVIFGAHEKRSIYYATSTDLEDWVFHENAILISEDIPFAKKNGNVFSTGNPLRLEDGNYLILLGVERDNGNYTSAYMVIDKHLKIVQQPQEIKIDSWHGESQNSFPLSLTKHDGLYRILLHKRDKDYSKSEIHEIIFKDYNETFNTGKGITSSDIIHKAKNESGYLRGKADDAAYISYENRLYLFIGSEELPSEYLTSYNREYGLMKLVNGKWQHDQRSPILVNPVNISEKYPQYDWVSDHLGGFISPIIHKNYLYLFLTFGSDNPDYYLAGIKVSLKNIKY